MQYSFSNFHPTTTAHSSPLRTVGELAAEMHSSGDRGKAARGHVRSSSEVLPHPLTFTVPSEKGELDDFESKNWKRCLQEYSLQQNEE